MEAIVHALDVLMFAAACVLLLAGFPVAFTLAGVALIFALLGHLAGASITMGAIPSRIFGTMTNEVLVAVPLFVFMGVMLERSKVAEDLLETMGRLFGTLRGGLGISVALVGALLAASTGIVGATVVTMGLLSLPTMLKNGYDPRLATGIISASGTLGQIIPPSIILVLLGDQLQGAYQRAQLDAGIFSPDAVSVGDLFAGALLPGLALVALYILYIVAVAILRPAMAPAMQSSGSARPGLAESLTALGPALALIIAVLGSILGGVATPTEAAAVGAVGATLLAGHRQSGSSPYPVLLSVGCLVSLFCLSMAADLRLGRFAAEATAPVLLAAILTIGLAAGLIVSLARVMRTGILKAVLESATHITCMVFVILIGATFFSLVFRDLGGEELVRGLLTDLPGGALGAVIVVMGVIFLLGFFLDFLEIIFVVVPIVAPILLQLEMPDGELMSPVWLGIMIAINLQTSFLTPPFGFALFYLRGVAPADLRTLDIYRGIVPFVAIQVVALIALWFFPQSATWLPGIIYGP